MKKTFILLIMLSIFILSCSNKVITLRRLDEINRAGKSLNKNPNNEEVIRYIIDAAQNGNREARSEALWILANIKTPLAYSEFLRLSVEDPDFNVRAMAILGLGELGSDTDMAINNLTSAIFDIDVQVQIEALNVAGYIKDERLTSHILKSLSSKNKWVRMAAVEALKDYEDDRVEASLLAISKSDKDFAVRSLAVQVIDYRENEV